MAAPQKMKRQASGKAKPKAIGKANPTTPAQRGYPWGGPAIKKGGTRSSKKGY